MQDTVISLFVNRYEFRMLVSISVSKIQEHAPKTVEKLPLVSHKEFVQSRGARYIGRHEHVPNLSVRIPCPSSPVPWDIFALKFPVVNTNMNRSGRKMNIECA